MLLPSQNVVQINPETNQVTIDTNKYKYLLGKVLGIEESSVGSSAEEVLASKLNSLSRRLYKEGESLGNALNELDLIYDYFSL